MKIHDCEQRTEEWHRLRAGVPTASEFSKLVTSKGEPSKSMEKYAVTLAAEVMAGGPVDAWQGNAHTERGAILEPEAISLYEFVHGATVEPVGFVTSDCGRWGCSPDGLVGDDGMVEVKCLKAENHIEAVLYYEKNERPQTTYIQQTQGQMYICERQWCDLIFYHPVLPLLVIRETPILDVVAGLVTQLADVLQERDRIVAILKKSKMEKAA